MAASRPNRWMVSGGVLAQRSKALMQSTREAEGTGLEPVRACAQRFSRPPPYQLGLALPTGGKPSRPPARRSTIGRRDVPVARVLNTESASSRARFATAGLVVRSACDSD